MGGVLEVAQQGNLDGPLYVPNPKKRREAQGLKNNLILKKEGL
jgi:hypothetical protein